MEAGSAVRPDAEISSASHWLLRMVAIAVVYVGGREVERARARFLQGFVEVAALVDRGQNSENPVLTAGETRPGLQAGVGFPAVLVRRRHKQRRRDGRNEVHPRKPVGLHSRHRGRDSGILFFHFSPLYKLLTLYYYLFSIKNIIHTNIATLGRIIVV